MAPTRVNRMNAEGSGLTRLLPEARPDLIAIRMLRAEYVAAQWFFRTRAGTTAEPVRGQRPDGTQPGNTGTALAPRPGTSRQNRSDAGPADCSCITARESEAYKVSGAALTTRTGGVRF